jgi:hypothetical protein
MHIAPHVMPSMMSEHHPKTHPDRRSTRLESVPGTRVELTDSSVARPGTNATGSTSTLQARRVCIYAHCIAHALAHASCELSLLYVTCC